MSIFLLCSLNDAQSHNKHTSFGAAPVKVTPSTQLYERWVPRRRALPPASDVQDTAGGSGRCRAAANGPGADNERKPPSVEAEQMGPRLTDNAWDRVWTAPYSSLGYYFYLAKNALNWLRVTVKPFIISAVKRLITINCIQNKSFCLHSICVCAVFIYYVYI